MRLRDAYTTVSCWRTWHWWPNWERPSPSRPPVLGSAFPLLPGAAAFPQLSANTASSPELPAVCAELGCRALLLSKETQQLLLKTSWEGLRARGLSGYLSLPGWVELCAQVLPLFCQTFPGVWLCHEP